MLRLNPKWKRRGAARAASGDTVGQIESKLVACGPLVGCIVDSAVHVVTSEQQDSMLERACYGRPAGQGERDFTGARTASSEATGLPAGILPWAAKLHDLTKERDCSSGVPLLQRLGSVYKLFTNANIQTCADSGMRMRSLPGGSGIALTRRKNVECAGGQQSTRPGRVYQLALEEAFFLSHTLQCLEIHSLEALEVGPLVL